MNTNEINLKLQGKVNILEELILDHNYQIALKGQITNKSEESNQDGTFVVSYTFRPLVVEILTDKGQVIKSKDTSKRSKALRNRLFLLYQESQTSDDFETFYTKSMNYLIGNLDILLTTPLN